MALTDDMDTDEVRDLMERAARAVSERTGHTAEQADEWDAELASRVFDTVGIPLATLAGLATGRLVAVPREATKAMKDAGMWHIQITDDPHELAGKAWVAMLAAVDGEGGA